MSAKKILVADVLDGAIVEQLRGKYGAENVLVWDHADIADPKSLEKSEASVRDIAEFQPDIVVVRSTNLNIPAAKEVLQALKDAGKETLFVRAGSGVDNVTQVAEMGFVVENTLGANKLGVVDLQLAMMAELLFDDKLTDVDMPQGKPRDTLEVLKLVHARREVAGGVHRGDVRETVDDETLAILRNDRRPELVGKVMFVTGATGNIGGEIVRLAQALGMVVAAEIVRDMTEEYAREHDIVAVKSLEDGLKMADIVSLNTPSIDGVTKGMMTQERFDVMKKSGAILINTARADLIAKDVETHVTVAIDDAMDAIYALNLQTDLLLTTPKRGAKTVESTAQVGVMVGEQIEAFVERGEYVNVTNPEALEGKAGRPSLLDRIVAQADVNQAAQRG